MEAELILSSFWVNLIAMDDHQTNKLIKLQIQIHFKITFVITA